MLTKFIQRVCFLGAAFGMIALANLASAEDPKTPSTDKPEDLTKAPASLEPVMKLPEWNKKYINVSDVHGEVVSADDQKMTIRIYFLAVANKKNNRPNLHHNHGRTMGNPYNRQPRIQVKWEHHDYTLAFTPEALVRVKSLPPKLNEKGEKIGYTKAEIDLAAQPYGAPHYSAAKADLTPGTLVEVSLVRDRAIAADKVTENDLQYKYVVITGKNPTPEKNLGIDPSNGNKKKK